MSAPRPVSRAVQSAWWVICLIGLACLAGGVATVFGFRGAKPAPALVIVGAVLLLAPLLIGRLQAIAVGPSRFELRLTQQIADQGAPKTARLLDDTDLGRLVESYSMVRGLLRGSDFRDARIHVQDSLVSQATAFAGRHAFDPGEVRSLFPRAVPAVRVLLIGLMLGDPRLLDAEVLGSAIQQPASANEQYQGLVAVGLFWARFSLPQQTGLLTAVTCAVIPERSKRRSAADKVLDLGRGLPMPR